MSGTNSIINLNSNRFTASVTTPTTATYITSVSASPPKYFASNLKFSGDANINTVFDGNNIGNIVVDGKIPAGTVSTLDFSGANSVKINLDTQGRTSASPVSCIIFEAKNGGAVLNPQNDLSKITLEPVLNPNLLYPLIWEYNKNTYTLTGTPQVTTSPNLTLNQSLVLEYLTTPSTNSSPYISDVQLSTLQAAGNVESLSQAADNLSALIIPPETQEA